MTDGPDARAEAFLTGLAAGDAPIDARAVAVVAAHPDDESIGIGGQLDRLRDVSIVHVTDGAPANMADARRLGFATRDAYAAARRRELEAAMALAGIPPARLASLEVPDQEAGARLAEIAGRLARLFLERGVEVVVTHPFEGGHPDHDATAFGVHAAARLIVRSGRPGPALVEMTSYHERPDGGMATHEFRPDASRPVLTLPMDERRRHLKRRLYDAHASQSGSIAAFGVEVERFRVAPDYDFAAPPRPLWYERHPWGMSGDRWRALASAALARLRDAPPWP